MLVTGIICFVALRDIWDTKLISSKRILAGASVQENPRKTRYLPCSTATTYIVRGKVMFSDVAVLLFTGGGVGREGVPWPGNPTPPPARSVVQSGGWGGCGSPGKVTHPTPSNSPPGYVVWSGGGGGGGGYGRCEWLLQFTFQKQLIINSILNIRNTYHN